MPVDKASWNGELWESGSGAASQTSGRNLRMVPTEARPLDGGHRGHAHRHAGVPAIRPLHHIDRSIQIALMQRWLRSLILDTATSF